VRQLHAGAQRHLHEVRHVRVNDGVFVREWNAIGRQSSGLLMNE
jgi:hypothetical protein